MHAPPLLADRRYAGLDGLRAIAVVAVLAYHLLPPELVPGGFLGVDVFFVLSGFLITSLLVRERARTGRIDLPSFWRRRARRLLPALGVLVIVCAAAATIIGGDATVRLGAQVLGAVTFSSNWVEIAQGNGYFAQTAPPLLQNLWSLGVEEQFYIVWPLVLIGLLALVRSRVAAAASCVLLAAASAAWAATLASPLDASRAYFGTDTHAFGLLLGAALALVAARWRGDGDAWRWWQRAGAGLVGTVGLVGIVALVMTTSSSGAATHPWMLVAASIATLACITGAIVPGSKLGAALDVAPLRWIGERSYGIYLWHWPLWVLSIAAIPDVPRSGATGVSLGLGVAAATFVIAAASYRFVEQPVRRWGLRRAVRRFPIAKPLTATTAGIAALGLVALGSIGIANAPGTSSAERAIAAGAASPNRAASPQPGATPTDAPSLTPVPSASPSAAPSPTPEQTAPPAPPAPPAHVITAIGDSVMLASAPGLTERFPGIQIDAAVSRQLRDGAAIVEQLAAAGGLGDTVVIGLGTNGPIDAADVQRIVRAVGPARHLIFVDAYAERAWIAGVNAALRETAARCPAVEAAAWHDTIAGQLGLLAGDHIHPGRAGGAVYANVVAEAIDRADARAAAPGRPRSSCAAG